MRHRYMQRALCYICVALVLTITIGCTRSKTVPLELLSTGNLKALHIEDEVQLNFNQPLGTLTIECHPPVALKSDVSEDGQTVVIAPSEVWAYATTYDLVVQGFGVQFTTQSRPEVSVFAGGDVLLDKRPGENTALFGPAYVFAGLDTLLKQADIRFVNLESPASERGQPVLKNFTFRSSPEALNTLVSAGIDLVTFANNHSFDYGLEAFLDTLAHLEAREIKYVGAGKDRAEATKTVIFEHDGIKVGFVSFMQRTILPTWSAKLWEAGANKPGVVFLDEMEGRMEVQRAVERARTEVDVVLLSLHWGIEGTRAPQAWQRELAKAAIDAGADAILGSHPHLPFGIEIYQGKPIVYSMGNLLFHPYDPEARESFVVLLKYGPEGLLGMEVHPILMNDGTVALLEGTAANAVLELITARSRALGTELVRAGDILLFEPEGIK